MRKNDTTKREKKETMKLPCAFCFRVFQCRPETWRGTCLFQLPATLAEKAETKEKAKGDDKKKCSLELFLFKRKKRARGRDERLSPEVFSSSMCLRQIKLWANSNSSYSFLTCCVQVFDPSWLRKTQKRLIYSFTDTVDPHLDIVSSL